MTPRKRGVKATPTATEPTSVPGAFIPGTIPAPLLEPHPGHQTAPVEGTGDGLPPMRTQMVDGQRRYRVIVEAIKIPAEHRDVIRPILPDPDAVLARQFCSVLGADAPDDDPQFPAGHRTALDGPRVFYGLMATADEIEAIRGASNCVDVRIAPVWKAL